MAIDPTRYNSQDYWQGRLVTPPDDAGYSYYRPVWLTKFLGDAQNPNLDCAPEFMQERARKLVQKLQAGSWKMLEVGCGPGSIVYSLRQFYGQDALGMDISQWAINWGISVFNGSDPNFGHMVDPTMDMTPYLTQHNATQTPWPYSSNYFNLVFSFNFFQCIEEAEVQTVIDEMDRVRHAAGYTYHLIRSNVNPDYYTVPVVSSESPSNSPSFSPSPSASPEKLKLDWWADTFDWPNNTILVDQTGYEVVL